MDWIEILKLIGIVIGVIFVITWILMNVIVSRVLSILFCGLSMYTAFENMANLDGIFWTCTMLTAIAWILFVGEGFFGHETGWVFIDFWGDVTPEIVRGPIFHIVTSLLVFGLAYHYIAVDHTILFYLIPGGIILLDVISFFTRL